MTPDAGAFLGAATATVPDAGAFVGAATAMIPDAGVLLDATTARSGRAAELDALHERAVQARGDRSATFALALMLGAARATPPADPRGTDHAPLTAAPPSAPAVTPSALADFEVLATLGAADVTVARTVEPHLDALSILAECPDPIDLAAIGAEGSSTWGVFAAEGPGVRLTATPDAHGGWLLDGTKPWCSLAGELSHALVTAHTDEGRRLFAVALQRPGVRAHPEGWIARGFPSIPSAPTDFARVPAVPVGATGWYLHRSGFERGGIGVAACWFGGALGLARAVVASAEARGDDLGMLHAGRVAAAVHSSRSTLAAAARVLDAGPGLSAGTAGDAPASASPAQLALLAQLTRTVVRRDCETVLREAAHALGPAPLAADEAHAARVADLDLYLRQDHGERDEARAGRLLSAREESA